MSTTGGELSFEVLATCHLQRRSNRFSLSRMPPTIVGHIQSPVIVGAPHSPVIVRRHHTLPSSSGASHAPVIVGLDPTIQAQTKRWNLLKHSRRSAHGSSGQARGWLNVWHLLPSKLKGRWHDDLVTSRSPASRGIVDCEQPSPPPAFMWVRPK